MPNRGPRCGMRRYRLPLTASNFFSDLRFHSYSSSSSVAIAGCGAAALHSSGRTTTSQFNPHPLCQNSRQFFLLWSVRKCFTSSFSISAGSPPPSSPLLMVSPNAIIETDDKEKEIEIESPNAVIETDDKERESEWSDDYYKFFSVAEPKEYRIQMKFRSSWQRELLAPDEAICIGSSHGWLAMANRANGHHYLFNPFIHPSEYTYIPLPPVQTLGLIRMIRATKSDMLSPRPSLATDFITEDHHNIGDPEVYFKMYRMAMSSPPIFPWYSSRAHQNSNIDTGNCTLTLLFRRSVFFCQPGEDERWTELFHHDEAFGYSDIIYFSPHARFYALSRKIDAVCMVAWDWDLRDCPKCEVISLDPPPKCEGEEGLEYLDSDSFSDLYQDSDSAWEYEYLDSDSSSKQKRKSYSIYYLVESSGDLLLTVRQIIYVLRRMPVYPFDYREADYYTSRFDVYKMDFDRRRWEAVEGLGERALFVGANHSFSLSTSHHPDLRPNTIYFTDDYNSAIHAHDNGFFNLEDGFVQPFYPAFKRIHPPPIFVAPSAH